MNNNNNVGNVKQRQVASVRSDNKQISVKKISHSFRRRKYVDTKRVYLSQDVALGNCLFVVRYLPPVSEMTYTVSSGTLNSSIPYHTSWALVPGNSCSSSRYKLDAFLSPTPPNSTWCSLSWNIVPATVMKTARHRFAFISLMNNNILSAAASGVGLNHTTWTLIGVVSRTARSRKTKLTSKRRTARMLT